MKILRALSTSLLLLAACGGESPLINPPDGGGTGVTDSGSTPGTDGGGTPGTDGGGTPGTDGGGTSDAGGGTADAGPLANFSFFVTSLESMRLLSGSQDGFGGDLRYGGEATGIGGADKICTTIAETAMPGAGAKGWRAFLSASQGAPDGGAVHAIERIGAGPWYDRLGRLVASNLAGLTSANRPTGSTVISSDLPNERGVPNHQGVDNHDTLTGSTNQGRWVGGSTNNTCADWTSKVGALGRPMAGHSWPAGSGMNWIQAHQVPGCGAGVNLVQNGGGNGTTTVGGGGGYGGLYCFALTP